ncbi:MAG: cyclic nucleotide-binding domain-containing protein [Caldilineaceae bacterium]
MNIVQLFRNEEQVEFYQAGQTIFAAGDQGQFMYVVKEGEVDIVVKGKCIETIGAGGIFGELALVDQSTRSAAAIAKSACQLVPINERRFTFLVQETPFFALHMMRVMAQRLRNRTDEAVR